MYWPVLRELESRSGAVAPQKKANRLRDPGVNNRAKTNKVLQDIGDSAVLFKKLVGLLDAHVENIGNRKTFVACQCDMASITTAITDTARTTDNSVSLQFVVF